MSKFIPAATVMRETWMQAQRRIYVERMNAAEITALKERLKSQPSILEELTALGLTFKHAQNLQGRLQFLNQREERIKNEKAPTVDPEAIQEAAKAQEVSNFEVVQTWDARNATPEEREALLGKPLADQLNDSHPQANEAVQVTGVDVANKTVTVAKETV